MSCIRQLTKRLYPAHPAAGVEKRAYSLKEKDMEVLVVKDEDGVLRPQAGIWAYTAAGKISADIYQEKNEDVEIVLAKLTEK